ncbi:MAG: hypothetical protein ACXWVM_22670 [Polyangiales bacterium]
MSESSPSGWFGRLLSFYLHRRTPKPATADEGNAQARAERATRMACLQCALSGASAGLTSTGAAAITASTEGVAGFVALPVAAFAIGGEMALRTLIHIELICTMADIFGVRLDPKKPDEVWRLCALVFGNAEHDDEGSDPGKKLVHELAHLETDKVGEEIGHRVLGESVARNFLPVVGVGVSAVVNWRKTQRIGDTARRYMRYSRALSGAFERITKHCSEHFELLVEGVWFVFIADGRLGYEESALLANLVRSLPHGVHERVLARFVEDEFDWLERLAVEVKGDARRPFLHALEVAAAVDKVVGLPERRLLRSAARRLELQYDPKRAEVMMEELEATGILSVDF